MNRQELLASYDAFLRSKVEIAPTYGFEVSAADINPLCKPHQRDIIRWAVLGGRRAIFAAFGLGKSIIQIETARQIQRKEGGRFLCVAPLGVRFDLMQDGRLETDEFRRRADELSLDYDRVRKEFAIDLQFIRNSEGIGGDGFYLTNYESVREGKIDIGKFSGVSLDEAAILRGFGGTKTFREMMRLFESTATYRFVATATPSPNEFIELLAYSAFLGIMDVGQAKTRFFKRNSEKADQLTIHPHKEREFFLWLSTWAIFLEKPSDLGHSDEGYQLPEMEVHWHEIPSTHQNAGQESSGQGRLLRNSALGVSSAAREKRDSLEARIVKLKEIVSANKGTEGGIPEGILRTQQGEVACCAAGARQAKLQGETGYLSRAVETLEGGQSRAVPGVGGKSPRAQQGEVENPERGVVSIQQVAGCRDSSPEQTEEIRFDAEGLRCAARNAEWTLPGMPGAASESVGGSLPQNRQGAGDPLQDLQCGDRSTPGRPGGIDAGGAISEQFIVWCDLNDEQRGIDQALADLNISRTSLYGSTDIDEREKMLAEWRHGETTAFVSKPMMYGAGVNLQQCSTAIFMGVGFKFAEFFQATKRIHRFLQKNQVHIHIIYTEAEREVRKELERKWQQHRDLTAQMSAIIKEFGLATNALEGELSRTLGVEREEVRTANSILVHNDSVIEAATMDSDTVDLILTSVPFSTQYEYSPSFNDFGHTDSNEHFWQQMDFLIPSLLRILKPGRVAAIHVKDRIVPGGLTGRGYQTVYRFSDACCDAFEKHGFGFLARKTIVTDVVRENNQTYRLGWTEQCKDGSRMGAGMPEYLLLFRKDPSDTSNGYADIPVVKDKAHYTRSRWQIDAHGFMRSSGQRLLAPEDLVGVKHSTMFKMFREYSGGGVYDFEHHVALSESLERCRRCGHLHVGEKACLECDCKIDGSILPKKFMLLQPVSWHEDVWTDITRMLTLNGAQYSAGRELHLCPIQFDIVDRVIDQFTMPGETVFDPFSGLGTVAMRAVEMGRKGYGVELASGYFKDAVQYLEAAEQKKDVPTLFDFIEEEGAA